MFQDTGESGNTEVETIEGSHLTVRFGNSAPFTLYLEGNDTAAAIARHMGTADWRLPIYHYDDYEGWESFQYYDIPSQYEIPPGPQAIASEKAGEVYYSEPTESCCSTTTGRSPGSTLWWAILKSPRSSPPPWRTT